MIWNYGFHEAKVPWSILHSIIVLAYLYFLSLELDNHSNFAKSMLLNATNTHI